jgi:alpha-L-rhamnosidase
MVENGASTIWELWNGNTSDPKMNSQNHVMMLGDLLIWYYENLAGIKADLPGFKKIMMKPEIIEGLKNVNASFNSPYGQINSSWKKDKKQFDWDITIPANTTAEIYLPAANEKSIKESGKSISNLADMKFIRQDGNKMIYSLNSGHYSFQIK